MGVFYLSDNTILMVFCIMFFSFITFVVYYIVKQNN